MNFCCAAGNCKRCREYFERTGKHSTGIISNFTPPRDKDGNVIFPETKPEEKKS